MEVLMEYVWEAREFDLKEFIDSGYKIMYQDVNLSVIYEELENCFKYNEVVRNIKDIFGYYGPGALLKVNGIFYWLMQV